MARNSSVKKRRAKAFVTQLRVRFGHVDPAGIAYFPKIYDYIHEAFEELWHEHVGVRYDHLLLDQQIGFPLVHSEVDFKRPLHFGDRPVVRVTCLSLGTSSFTLHYVYTVDDEVAVDARMTTVCVDLKPLKSRPIPDEYRSKFEEILERP